MAIAFKNSGAKAAIASGNCVLNAPDSPSNNDIWLLVALSRDNTPHLIGKWAQIYQGATSTQLQCSLWWHRYAGSNPDLTLVHSDGNMVIAGIAAFSGCITTGNPIDTVGTVINSADASGGKINITGITPSVEDTMLVAIDWASDDIGHYPNPTFGASDYWGICFENPGGGQENCYVSNLGNDGAVAAFYHPWTSGATGDVTDIIYESSAWWKSVMIALRPDTGGILPPSDGTPSKPRGLIVTQIFP